MLRSSLLKAAQVAKPLLSNAAIRPAPVVASRLWSSSTQVVESEQSADEKRLNLMINTLKETRGTPVCGYETRRIYQMCHVADAVPEPVLINEFMHSCRACNDLALAIRILESVKRKCGKQVGALWPYITQEIRPTIDELGIPLPEEIGYDQPELYLESVFDMH